MSVSSMASSAGRVIGPPVFGALYSTSPRFPYRAAALCTLGAAAVYAYIAMRTRPKSEVRPATPLAERDSARAMSLKRTPSGMEALKVANATAQLQELLAVTLQQRGYDLGNAAVVELLKQLIVEVLPVRADGCTDEQVHMHMHMHCMHIGAVLLCCLCCAECARCRACCVRCVRCVPCAAGATVERMHVAGALALHMLPAGAGRGEGVRA